MIILNLNVRKYGTTIRSKSYYCNVADKKQLPESELTRVQHEYCECVRKYGNVSKDYWSDESILDYYGWDYSNDIYDVNLNYAHETEQIWPL